MKSASILLLAAATWLAATWLAASGAAAQNCGGKAFETAHLTATCENGVMVYRGYAPQPVTPVRQYPPERSAPTHNGKGADFRDRGPSMATRIIERYYGTSAPGRDAAPPASAAPRKRMVREKPAPRARMIPINRE